MTSTIPMLPRNQTINQTLCDRPAITRSKATAVCNDSEYVVHNNDIRVDIRAHCSFSNELTTTMGKEAPLDRYLLTGRLLLRANKRSGDEDQGLVVM
jgi:hypothetical protein